MLSLAEIVKDKDCEKQENKGKKKVRKYYDYTEEPVLADADWKS